MIEIARAIATSAPRPRRSILFVFHTAEEDGLVGSDYFTRHPTVALDSIVAHINLDMIGRGGAGEELNGGPQYLQVIGARRRSAQLGDLVEMVSTEKGYDWSFDHSVDESGHPEQVYCRSDHFNYARFGIPVVFLSTGTHADYHQVTDEADRVDYGKLARVGSFVRDLLLRLAEFDNRLALDKPKPNPSAPCVH
jgi:Zn-dependent M28 family amino/carboxypeptidase